MSAFEGKADIKYQDARGSLWPKADIGHAKSRSKLARADEVVECRAISSFDRVLNVRNCKFSIRVSILKEEPTAARLPRPLSAYVAFVLCIVASFAICWLDLSWLDRSLRMEILDGLIGASVVSPLVLLRKLSGIVEKWAIEHRSAPTDVRLRMMSFKSVTQRGLKSWRTTAILE
jgi:hypothetical protein